jgi:GT2 family glycosyltransferase
VVHDHNEGFAKAHNQAIHWTKSEYVLCLNQDIELAPECFERLVRFMDDHPDAGAATPKLLRLQDGERTNYIDSVGLEIYKNFQIFDTAQGELDEGKHDIDEEVFGASGACPIYRRSAIEDVRFEREFFDEDFFAYQEDIDLSFRLRSRGWQIWRVGSAVVYHARSAREAKKQTLSQIIRNRKKKNDFVNFYSYRNHLYLLNKNFVQWRFFPRIFWREFLKLAYVVFAETKNLSVWRDVFKNFAKMTKKLKKNDGR